MLQMRGVRSGARFSRGFMNFFFKNVFRFRNFPIDRRTYFLQNFKKKCVNDNIKVGALPTVNYKSVTQLVCHETSVFRYNVRLAPGNVRNKLCIRTCGWK